MDKKSIKGYIELMEKSTLSMLEIKEGEFQIRMERASSQPTILTTYTTQQQPQVMTSPQNNAVANTIINDGVVDLNNVSEIKSPMIGVFYASPKPDSEPFVKRGDKVKKGDVVCIIEAMKLMNEILSEYDGEVVDICASNGQMVEYSQVLFKIY